MLLVHQLPLLWRGCSHQTQKDQTGSFFVILTGLTQRKLTDLSTSQRQYPQLLQGLLPEYLLHQEFLEIAQDEPQKQAHHPQVFKENRVSALPQVQGEVLPMEEPRFRNLKASPLVYLSFSVDLVYYIISLWIFMMLRATHSRHGRKFHPFSRSIDTT